MCFGMRVKNDEYLQYKAQALRSELQMLLVLKLVVVNELQQSAIMLIIRVPCVRAGFSVE